MEGYLELGINATLNLLFPFYDTVGNIFSVVLSWIIVLGLVLLPLVLAMIFYMRYRQLKNASFKYRLGESLEMLDLNNKASIMCHSIFMMRRLIFVALAIFLVDYGLI